MHVLRGILTAVGVGGALYVLPDVPPTVCWLFFRWPGSVIFLMYSVLLGLCIWVITEWWLRVGTRTRIALTCLALLNIFGAPLYGIAFAVFRYRLRREAEREEELAAQYEGQH